MPKDDEIVKAIRHKLNIPVDQGNYDAAWREFRRDSRNVEKIRRVASELAGMLKEAIEQRLGQHAPNAQFADSLLESFAAWIQADAQRRSPHINGVITKALAAARPLAIPANAIILTRHPSPKPGTSKLTGLRSAVTPPLSSPRMKPMTPPAPPRANAAVMPAPRTADDPLALTVADDLAEGAPPVAQWKYLDVPETPDKHAEDHEKSRGLEGGITILGARVRGRKHKHEGTNCDDWFEFRTAGPWTVVAVSDGAGSRRFSRVGAQVSVEAAASLLTKRLESHVLEPRREWSHETFRHQEQSSAFAEADIEFVQTSLHDAVLAARQAVEAAAAVRMEKPEYEGQLGRKIQLGDLSATLLVAVHRTVRFLDDDYSFVMACQVGDGITAAVDAAGGLHLLGVPDSGKFSGETEFLTSPKFRDRMNLAANTVPFFGRLRAMMTMTDGVADVYFPNDPGILRLFADLTLNKIVTIGGLAEEEIANAAEFVKQQVGDKMYHSREETPAREGARAARIRYADKYADLLGLPIADLVSRPALLAAGGLGEPLYEARNAGDRLRTWLDCFNVRGEFDDRTLVILHREVV